jgi:hypothetical protein
MKLGNIILRAYSVHNNLHGEDMQHNYWANSGEYAYAVHKNLHGDDMQHKNLISYRTSQG